VGDVDGAATGSQRMTPLGERIVRLIETEGPIDVARYMALCLFDPDHGYYTTREPFGVSGDFTTAPEISQMFGELVGIWLGLAWDAAGRPQHPVVAEIGPGRGTMMRDMLRALARTAPALLAGAEVALVEASPRLRAQQQTLLADAHPRLSWRAAVSELESRPLLIVGNELFDALPARQFVHVAGRWHERVVGLDGEGRLSFGAGAAVLAGGLPTAAADGAIFEQSPAREALMDEVALRLARDGGTCLFIDYGHLRAGVGDTLQALGRHAYADPLDAPGEADVTSHVDFAALAAVASAHGLEAYATTQGEFLVRLGLIERAGRLGATMDEAGRAALSAAVDRLAGPDQMGTLFKVFAISARGLPPLFDDDMRIPSAPVA
jgi:SAM-dependent MidA family methyltransferase